MSRLSLRAAISLVRARAGALYRPLPLQLADLRDLLQLAEEARGVDRAGARDAVELLLFLPVEGVQEGLVLEGEVAELRREGVRHAQVAGHDAVDGNLHALHLPIPTLNALTHWVSFKVDMLLPFSGCHTALISALSHPYN